MSWVAHFLDTHSDTPLEPSVLARALADKKVFCKKKNAQISLFAKIFVTFLPSFFFEEVLGPSQFSSREDKE